jgi:hypothetical protein
MTPFTVGLTAYKACQCVLFLSRFFRGLFGTYLQKEGFPMTDKAKPPSGLSAGGRRFWREITAAYELRVDESLILEKACRTVDDLGRLEAELAASPVLVAGSMGQTKVSPLFAECRATRALLAALLKQIDVPDPVEVQRLHAVTRSAQATKAARAKWDKTTQPSRSA